MFAAIIVSCGGSSSEPDVSSDATSTPPSNPVATTLPVADHYTIESIIDGLSLDHVDPSKFISIESTEISNRSLALGFEDPDLWLGRFAEWGREMGYIKEYTLENGIGGLILRSEIYGDGSGAKKAFKAFNDEYVENLERLNKTEMVESASSGEVDGGSMGEETFRHRNRTNFIDDFDSFHNVFVSTRDGNMISSALWGSEENMFVCLSLLKRIRCLCLPESLNITS